MGYLQGPGRNQVHVAAMETMQALDNQERTRQEVESLKLALITANPEKYIPLFFPEAIQPVISSDVERLLKENDPDGDVTQPTSEIEYALEAPTSEEAAEIIRSLLANKSGTIP